MPDSIGSLIRRALVVACLVMPFARGASAQTPPPAPPSPEFLPRYDFSMSAAYLGYDDDRFTWDTHWVGDFDLFDYGHGRATFFGDYQALLGSQFRPFDPYQSNYTLEASGSYRAGRTEIAGVINHVSRHLGDRFKRFAVAENSLGGRVMRRFASGGETIDLRVDLRKVIEQEYVDYTWFGGVDATVQHGVSPHTSVYGRLLGMFYAVDPSIAGRGRQSGGRVEGGLQVVGTAGTMQFFVGAERVIDADLLDRVPRAWGFFGFRLLRR